MPKLIISSKYNKKKDNKKALIGHVLPQDEEKIPLNIAHELDLLIREPSKNSIDKILYYAIQLNL